MALPPTRCSAGLIEPPSELPSELTRCSAGLSDPKELSRWSHGEPASGEAGEPGAAPLLVARPLAAAVEPHRGGLPIRQLGRTRSRSTSFESAAPRETRASATAHAHSQPEPCATSVYGPAGSVARMASA